MAIRDDWQKIYSFAGSRIELFIDFDRYFPNAQKNFINKTYRNPKIITRKASDFIMKNKLQLSKSIVSDKNINNPIQLAYYKNNLEQREIICKLLEQFDKHQEIGVLARTNSDLNKLFDSPDFIKTASSTYRYKERKITALTVHKSKGMTFDQVIILNASDDRFPGSELPKYWIEALFMDEIAIEPIANADDRRILYIALTRPDRKSVV